jgi:hypothetical protein
VDWVEVWSFDIYLFLITFLIIEWMGFLLILKYMFFIWQFTFHTNKVIQFWTSGAYKWKIADVNLKLLFQYVFLFKQGW